VGFEQQRKGFTRLGKVAHRQQIRVAERTQLAAGDAGGVAAQHVDEGERRQAGDILVQLYVDVGYGYASIGEVVGQLLDHWKRSGRPCTHPI
jgi:hypothetical protein